MTRNLMFLECLYNKNKKELEQKIKKCEDRGLECEGKMFREEIKGEMNYCQVVALYAEWK